MTTTEGRVPTTLPRLTPRLRVLLVTLIPTMLSIYLVWGAYGVVLAAQVEDVVGTASKEASYGVVATIGAVIALFAQPLAGILSDRTRTRFGRRGPFLIGAPLVAAVGFIGLGTANTIVQIAASWFALQIALNFTQGPLTTVLPDRVPTERRGLFSTILGLGGGLGLMAGQVIGSTLVPRYLLVWCLFGGIIVVALMAFALLNPEGSNVDQPRERFDLRGFLGSFWVSPRRHPDFAWAFLGRMFVNFGFMLVSMYLLYVLQEYIGLDRADALGMLFPVAIVALVIAAIATSRIKGVR